MGHRVFGRDWFVKHQTKLLWWLNAPVLRYWFRWVLRINGERSAVGDRDVIFILPHAIWWGDGDSFVAEFRTHNKFAKRLYYAFEPLWWTMHFWDWLIADRWVPRLSFGFNSLTKYPYPGDATQNTVDGWCNQQYSWYSGVSWSTIRGGTGTNASDTDSYKACARVISDSTSDNYIQLDRSIFLFDTSALTSSATISAATMSLYNNYGIDGGGNGFSVNIYTSAPASNTAVVAGDFDSLGTTAQCDTAITFATFGGTQQYRNFTLNSTGRGNISKTGVTKFGARESVYDATGSEPNWGDNYDAMAECHYADETGTSQDPKLVVTYEYGGITERQSKGNSDDTSGTSIAVTLSDYSVAVGNTIVVAVYGGTSQSCSDNLGNTYGSAKVTNGRLSIFSAPVTTGGSCTVTVSWSSATTYRRIAAAEFTGNNLSNDVTANQGPVSGGTGTDAITSTSATTTADGELIVGGVINVDTSWSTFNPGTNYTQLEKLPASNSDFMMEYRTQQSQGSTAATWTVNNTDSYRAVMASFKTGMSYTYTGAVFGPWFFSSQRAIEKLVSGAVAGTGWLLSTRNIERVATGGFAAVDTWVTTRSIVRLATGTVNATLSWTSTKTFDISLTGTLSSVRTWLSDRMIEKYVDGSITAVDTWTAAITGLKVDQEYFQYYKDDGSESAATALGALNQNRTGVPNDFVRLRFLVYVTGEAGSRQYKLEWRRDGTDTWREVIQ